MSLPQPADADQSLLLEAVWEACTRDQQWPAFGTVDREVHRRHRLDAVAVLRRTDPGLLVRGRSGAPPGPDEALRLTVAGVAACPGTEELVERFLVAVRRASEVEEGYDGDEQPTLTADQVVAGASNGRNAATSDAAGKPTRLLGLLLTSEPWTDSSSLYDGGWAVTVNRQVRAFAGVPDLASYWATRTSMLGPSPVWLASNTMTPARARVELLTLKEEAADPEVRRDSPAHDAWKAKAVAVMKAALGSESDTLRKFRALRYSIGISSGAPGEAEQDARYFTDAVDRAAALLDAALYEVGLRDEPPAEASAQHAGGPRTGSIFVVHGQDEAVKYQLLRVLDRTTDRDAVVLHEPANRGQTLLEKLEGHAEQAAYAVVLLTGDDEGRLRGDNDLLPRGRQNVVLELGYFLGLLGRKHVAVLTAPGVERPSDISGLVYIELDQGGGWRHRLLKELEAAGILVDYSKMP